MTPAPGGAPLASGVTPGAADTPDTGTEPRPRELTSWGSNKVFVIRIHGFKAMLP